MVPSYDKKGRYTGFAYAGPYGPSGSPGALGLRGEDGTFTIRTGRVSPEFRGVGALVPE